MYRHLGLSALSRFATSALALTFLAYCARAPEEDGEALGGGTKRTFSNRGGSNTPQSGATAPPDFRCRIADETNRNPVEVAPTIVRGEQAVQEVPTYYRGHRVVVAIEAGDANYPTQGITLKVDGVSSGVQDPGSVTLFTQTGRDYFLQCWVER